MKVITLIPCVEIHPYVEKFGTELYNTCIGVFRKLSFFDFPSLPRNFHVLALVECLEGSYEVYMRVVDNNDNTLASTVKQPIKIDQGIKAFVNLNLFFDNVIFNESGPHRFQLLSNDDIIYEYEFLVSKLQRKEYTQKEVEDRLEDPETIKRSNVIVKCECGFSKKFSLELDPSKQNLTEKLPEEEVIKCENCGKDINISPELKASMIFYLGTKNLRDTISRNLYESQLLAMNGFLNSALITQVSAFEAFMRDSFVVGYKNWFIYSMDEKKDLSEEISFVKTKMLSILGKMKIKDEFLDKVIKGNTKGGSGIEEILKYNLILKLILFGDENQERVVNKINFQQLQKENGCFWAYRIFFGIDIIAELKRQQKSYDYLAHLAESFKTRHKIIHNSSEVQLRGSGVDSDVLQKNEEIIVITRKYLVAQLLELDKKRIKLEQVSQ